MLGLLCRASRASVRLRCRSVTHLSIISQYHDSRGREVEPLRILYCGSDDFSVQSLRRLTEAHEKELDFIQSIDVVTKTPKRFGRGLKAIYQSPLGTYAEGAGLPVHPISTFTGWNPAEATGKNINLIIAVSFGLFVPPRILNGAQYGGLNIHPSLLPELRGPAPIHHTLIQNLRQTGVSLCTLDPKHFDHGQVLRQEKLKVPEASMVGYDALQQYLAPRGGDLLLSGLRDGCFMSPLETVMSLPEASHAPKLTADYVSIQWSNWSTDRILQTQKLGRPLQSYWDVSSNRGYDIDVRFYDLMVAARIGAPKPGCEPGRPRIYWTKEKKKWVDMTSLNVTRGKSRRIYPDVSARHETPFDPNVELADVKEHLPGAQIRVGKHSRPAIAGIWTSNGDFLTFSGLSIRKKPKIEGSVKALRALFDTSHTVEGTLEAAPGGG